MGPEQTGRASDVTPSVGQTFLSAPEQTGVSTLRWKLFLVLAACLLVYLYFGYPNAVPDFRADQEHDAFTYLFLANELRSGEGFLTKHWLPGYPVLLAGGLTVFGTDWLALKLCTIVLSISTLVMCALLYRRLLGAEFDALLALLLAATPLYFDFSHRLMSELPFVCFSILALVASLSIFENSQPAKGRAIWIVVLVVASAVAVMIRGNGLALVPALGVGFFIAARRRDRRAAIGFASALTACLAVYVGWSWDRSLHTFSRIDNVTYVDEVQAVDIEKLWKAGGYQQGVEKLSPGGMARRVYENVVWHQSYRVAGLTLPGAEMLAQVQTSQIGLALTALLLVPVALGFIRLGRCSAVVAMYLAVSVLMVVIYPTGGSARMLLPSLAALLPCVCLGLEQLFGKAVTKGWLAAALIANIGLCAVAADRQHRSPYSQESFADFLEVVTEEVPRVRSPQETVASPFPWVVEAFVRRPVDTIEDAVRKVEAKEFGSALVVSHLPAGNTAALKLPPRVAYERLAQRNDIVLARIKLKRE